MEDDEVTFAESVTISSNLLDGRPFVVRRSLKKANDTLLLFLAMEGEQRVTHVLKKFVQRFSPDEREDIRKFRADIEQEFNIMRKLEDATYVAKALRMHVCELSKDSELIGYILMEYTGPNLDSYLRSQKYTTKDVEKWFQQTLVALAYAEHKRIYHGDISLENVTVTAKGDVRIIDFGASLVIEEERYTKTTTSFNNKTKGHTSIYLPPEVIQNKLFSYNLVDVYCFGMTFYYLAARDKGLKKFTAEKKSEKDYQPFWKSLCTVTKSFSPEFVRTIKGALEYNMDKRMTFDRLRTAYYSIPAEVAAEETKCETRGKTVGILALGCANAGKTLLLRRLSGDVNEVTMPTVAIDYLTCTEHVGGQTVTLRMFDTCGQERLKSLVLMVYKQADLVLFVFDVADPVSFMSVRMWMDEARMNCKLGVPAILVANKIDETPCVSEKEQRELLGENAGLQLVKVSALKMTGMTELKAMIMKKAGEILARPMGKKLSTVKAVQPGCAC